MFTEEIKQRHKKIQEKLKRENVNALLISTYFFCK